AGHDRIAFEMAAKEPEVRIDIQLGDQFALAVLATHLADMNDAIDHQHVRCGQLRITGAKQLAAAATEQIFPSKGLLFGHAYSSMVPFMEGLLLFIRLENQESDHKRLVIDSHP